MKLYAPEYYKDFKCIADKCRHSCCVGWEIDIDSETAEAYTLLTEGYGIEIAKSMEGDPVPHFKLCGNDRCPHLNEQGLCRIILNIGEDALCDICREHPRFYNDLPDCREVGVGMSCEEACRLILSSDSYCNRVCVGEAEGQTEKSEFDALSRRKDIYGIISDKGVPYADRLARVYEKYGVSPFLLDDGEWREILASLEYLDEKHRELFADYSTLSTPDESCFAYLERALAYFVYRHCTECADEEEFRSALGFCLFCERLLSYAVAEKKTDAFEAARIISEELEYSEDNTQALKDEFLFCL